MSIKRCRSASVMLDSSAVWRWMASPRSDRPIASSARVSNTNEVTPGFAIRRSFGSRRGGPDLGQRIYVGNIPFSATEEMLSEVFAEHGQVTGVDMIMDRDTDRPRGFAFVEMEDPGAVSAAIEALDGSDLDGQNLRVSPAQERRGGGGRG